MKLTSVEHMDARSLSPVLGRQLEERGVVWTEWGRLTRFLESAGVAFAREYNLWERRPGAG